MSRTNAREIAMKLVYSRMMGGDGTPRDIAEESDAAEPLCEED